MDHTTRVMYRWVPDPDNPSVCEQFEVIGESAMTFGHFFKVDAYTTYETANEVYYTLLNACGDTESLQDKNINIPMPDLRGFKSLIPKSEYDEKMTFIRTYECDEGGFDSNVDDHDNERAGCNGDDDGGGCGSDGNDGGTNDKSNNDAIVSVSSVTENDNYSPTHGNKRSENQFNDRDGDIGFVNNSSTRPRKEQAVVRASGEEPSCARAVAEKVDAPNACCPTIIGIRESDNTSASTLHNTNDGAHVLELEDAKTGTLERNTVETIPAVTITTTSTTPTTTALADRTPAECGDSARVSHDETQIGYIEVPVVIPRVTIFCEGVVVLGNLIKPYPAGSIAVPQACIIYEGCSPSVFLHVAKRVCNAIGQYRKMDPQELKLIFERVFNQSGARALCFVDPVFAPCSTIPGMILVA